ncbi:putative Anaphase-promoting complex subunit 5 [Nannochloris sp. 'desiccata']|nr:putative Anaphase-promoting complex subunit 5 [Chlorella desiccata (nom. nud.)]
MTTFLPPINFELPNRLDVLPTITPHQVALCFLVKGYLSPGENDPGGTWPQRQALGDALLTAVRESDTVREPTIRQLSKRLEAEVTRNLSTTAFADQGEYGKVVSQSLQAHMRPESLLDRLVVLFTQLANMVTTSTNSRAEDSVGADDNSVMGFFLRRCWCDFTSLSFEETCTLADACGKYSSLIKEDDAATLRTRAVTDRFLADHIENAERANITLGLPEYEDPVLDLLRHTNNTISEGSRARLAFAVARNDPISTIDAVHAQFDAPTNSFLPSIGVVASGETLHIGRERLRLQTAALKLAATHARMGNVELAMETLNEALRTAQVARDDPTLAHLLAVMCQTMETATPGTIDLLLEPPEGKKRSEAHVDELLVLLRKLTTRAEELGLPHLAGYARLGLARHTLIYPAQPRQDAELGKFSKYDGHLSGVGGDNSNKQDSTMNKIPREVPGMTGVFYPMYPSTCKAAIEIAAAGRYLAHLDLATSACAAVPSAPPSTSNLACLRILKNLPDMFVSTPSTTFGSCLMGAQGRCAGEVRKLAASSILLKSAGYSLFGGMRMQQSLCIAFLKSHSRKASTEDKAVALAQLAVTFSETKGFEAAEHLLKKVSKSYPETNNRVLYAARISIAHKRACHRRDIRYALELAGLMLAMGNPQEDTQEDPTLIGYRIEGEEMAAEAYFYGGHLQQAEKGARTGVWPIAIKHYQPLAHLKILLLLTKIFVDAQAWEVAKKYAFSLYSQCKEVHAEMLQAEAAVLLCRIFRGLGRENIPRALREMDSAMNFIMAHGGLDLKARARMELASSLMDKASTKEEIIETNHLILPLLKEARYEFRLLESFQNVQKCFYLESLVRDAMGDEERQTQCEEMMEKLQKERALGLGPIENYL